MIYIDKKEKGFSLIEVIVSISILGIMISFLVPILFELKINSVRQKEYFAASLVAKNKLNRLLSDRKVASGEETFLKNNCKYYIFWNVVKKHLLEFNVEIRWEDYLKNPQNIKLITHRKMD